MLHIHYRSTLIDYYTYMHAHAHSIQYHTMNNPTVNYCTQLDDFYQNKNCTVACIAALSFLHSIKLSCCDLLKSKDSNLSCNATMITQALIHVHAYSTYRCLASRYCAECLPHSSCWDFLALRLQTVLVVLLPILILHCQSISYLHLWYPAWYWPWHAQVAQQTATTSFTFKIIPVVLQKLCKCLLGLALLKTQQSSFPYDDVIATLQNCLVGMIIS